MKANRNELTMKASENSSTLKEAVSDYRPVTDGEIDLSLLDDSLAKTPWERMQANDDALRFSDLLRAAMEKRNAKSLPPA